MEQNINQTLHVIHRSKVQFYKAVSKGSTVLNSHIDHIDEHSRTYTIKLTCKENLKNPSVLRMARN